MGAFLRYFIFCGIVVGIAWASVTIQFGDQTAFTYVKTHGGQQWYDDAADWTAHQWNDATDWLAAVKDDFLADETEPPPIKKPRKRKAPRHRAPLAPKNMKPSAVDERRVALLREAAKQTQRRASPPAKTQVDASIRRRDRNAVDKLIALDTPSE